MSRRSRHWSESSAEAAECMREMLVDGASMRDAEDLAESILDRTRHGTPEDLAAALGLDIVLTDVLPEGMRGLLVEGFPATATESLHHHLEHESRTTTLMLVPRSARRPSRALVIFHEIAHHVLNGIGRPHTHGEVWRLTLALAFPRRMVREAWYQGKRLMDRVFALAALGVVPAWCAEARLEDRTGRSPVAPATPVTPAIPAIPASPESWWTECIEDANDANDASSLLSELASVDE